MDYILSPCTMTAEGLVGLMSVECQQITVLHPQSENMPSIPSTGMIKRVVVYLPDNPYWLLTTLQETALLLNRTCEPISMLILSRVSAAWLWQTLQKLVTHPQKLVGIRAISSDLPCSQLATLLHGGYHECLCLEQQAMMEEQVWGHKKSGLTLKEVSVLTDLFGGYSINRQSQVKSRSNKTLYCQRKSGLRKMAKHIPLLAANIPGARQKWQTEEASASLSALEREFIQAIHCRQVYPVFQPIVDGQMRLQGFEILVRWYRDGLILSPGEFLPQIRTYYAWLLLTASVLKEAVQHINTCAGRYYFSINVPPCIASSSSLVQMVMAARRQLRRSDWTEKLVLEFSETIDFNPYAQSGKYLARIKEQGFRIMLDDCFSQSSVIFPVRAVQFSDYKLDKSIIDDFQHDPHASALIKSLIYYSKLTGSQCIAEGIDSQKKLNSLLKMGVNHFQGYFISPPVKEMELTATITRFA